MDESANGKPVETEGQVYSNHEPTHPKAVSSFYLDWIWVFFLRLYLGAVYILRNDWLLHSWFVNNSWLSAGGSFLLFVHHVVFIFPVWKIFFYAAFS